MIVERVLRVHPSTPLVVGPNEPLREVSKRFERNKQSLAMLCDTEGHLVGVVSLGDIVHAVGERGADALDLPARMVMSPDVALCGPQDEIEDILKTMVRRGIRHMPVVDGGKLLGVVEKPDCLEVLYEEAALDFTQLRNYVFKTGGRF